MIDISKIEEKEIMEGFIGKFIHTEYTTLAFWNIKKGAVLPVHSHIHEQTTQVLEGKLELTIDGKTEVYKKGHIVVIPSNITHSGVALTDCKVFDIFSPVREDYKKHVMPLS